MIYVDTSVLLAALLAEDRYPPSTLWDEPLISSRLLEYELWTRLHARSLSRSHGDDARALLGRIALLEMVTPVLQRALEPFPKPVRTLDAIHLASVDFLRQRQMTISLATYDERMARAATALGITLHTLD